MSQLQNLIKIIRQIGSAFTNIPGITEIKKLLNLILRITYTICIGCSNIPNMHFSIIFCREWGVRRL